MGVDEEAAAKCRKGRKTPSGAPSNGRAERKKRPEVEELSFDEALAEVVASEAKRIREEALNASSRS